MGDTRVTQAPIEALSQPVPGVRASQAVVEVLGTTVAVVVTAARVTQAPAELLSLPTPPIRVSQAATEVLYGFGRWKLTIDGIDRTAIVDAFSYSTILNERGRARVVVADFLPEPLQEVVSYAKNGFTPLFGGVILTRTFRGRNQYDATFQVTCECGDWFTYADWATVSHIYDAEVSIKTVLQDVITEALGAYGITLHPLQVDGPLLAPFLWRAKKVSDALRELSDRTQYVAVITPGKQLRMFLPGTDAAPVTITEAAPHLQELSWSDSDRAGGAPVNKVTIICGPTGQREVHDERHYGDGVTRIFPLYAPFVAMIGALHIFSEHAGGYPVATCGVDIDVATGGDYPYCWNPETNAIKQRADQAVIVAGDYLWLWYLAEFPFQVTASTGATPIIELLEARTDILSIPAGQEVANGLLAQFGGGAGGDDRELAMTTDEDGFEVGQALSVSLPTTRSVAGAFVITELAMTIVLDPDQGEPYWTYEIKAGPAETVYQGSYLQDWRRIVASPSIITEVQAAETRLKNQPRKPHPTDPVYRPRYIEPGPAAAAVVTVLPAKPTDG